MPGPPESTDDVPRWEPPPAAPTESAPRWEPEPVVPRWEPDAAPARAQPPVAQAIGARFDEPPARRLPVAPPLSPLVAPFVWWNRHPWVVAWAAVCLVPVGVMLLRLVDDAGAEGAVGPLQGTLVALLALVLLRAVIFSARRSLVRLALGLLGSLAAIALLLWPVTRLTFGRVECPARAGVDLGVATAAAALQAWQRGDAAASAWRAGDPPAAWRAKARGIALIDYQLVDSGCFERIAPIDASRTWHDFRVTVKEPERAALSKVVVVHTAAGGEGWKITSIEGPLP